jgi:hypothetical protein
MQGCRSIATTGLEGKEHLDEFIYHASAVAMLTPVLAYHVLANMQSPDAATIGWRSCMCCSPAVIAAVSWLLLLLYVLLQGLAVPLAPAGGSGCMFCYCGCCL